MNLTNQYVERGSSNLYGRDQKPQSSMYSGTAVKANHAELVAWLVLNVWPSHLGLPVLVCTILLSRKIHRHVTFINMCITWMIIGFSSSLLLYAGYQTGPEPPFSLCLIQASLLYAQPGMTSLSAFALVFQVFYVIRAAFQERDPQNYHTLRKWVLVVMPYVALIAFAGVTLYVGVKNPERVSRDRRFFYCSVKDTILTNTITTFSFVVLLVTICLEVWIIVLTYKHWRVLRANVQNDAAANLNLIMRTSAFAMWVFLGMGLSLLSFRAPESPVPDMALATMGSAVVLVFGTQRDILQALAFWRVDPSERSARLASEDIVLPSNSSQHSTAKLRHTDSLTRTTSNISSIKGAVHACWGKRKDRGDHINRMVSSPVLRKDLSSSHFVISP